MLKSGYFAPSLKLLFHSEKITKWLAGEQVFPVMIEWFLSGSCNQKCNFCSFAHSHRKEFTSLDVATRTIQELSRLGVKSINWTGGGEPLMHPHFAEISRYAKGCGMQQGLFTNGSLLTPDLIKVIADTHTWIRFSIDAGMDRTYKEIRGVDHFNRVIKNIKSMVKNKKKCTVGAGFVITKDNVCDMQMFVDTMTYLGVDYIQFKPQIHPYYDTEQESMDFWKSKVRPRLELASKNPKVMVNLYKFQDLENGIGRQYDICYGWRFCPCIAGNKLYRCNYLSYMPEHCFGNLAENHFVDLWDKPDMKVIDKCQILCKNDNINKTLDMLRRGNAHENFL